mgnify:CR=1 FL=1
MIFKFYLKTKIKKYENFKSNLPDFSFLKEFLPDETYSRFADRLNTFYDTIHPPNLDRINGAFSDLRNLAATFIASKNRILDGNQGDDDNNEGSICFI